MGDDDRLVRIETAISSVQRDVAALVASLHERCRYRGGEIDDLREDVTRLKGAESRREGGKAMLIALISAASVVGGLIAKLLPIGK